MDRKDYRPALLQDLRWHQSQLYYFLDLYYNKQKFSEQEREYYKKYTDHTYRTHLMETAKLQKKLNQCDSEAIL